VQLQAGRTRAGGNNIRKQKVSEGHTCQPPASHLGGGPVNHVISPSLGPEYTVYPPDRSMT
jgi:hypothetical protein